MAHDLKLFSINSEGRLNLDLKAHMGFQCIESLKMVGRIVGKSIVQGRYVGIGFSDVLCRYLMDRESNQSYLEDLLVILFPNKNLDLKTKRKPHEIIYSPGF